MLLILLLSIYPPFNIKAYDTPNDGGKSIIIEWDRVDDTTLAGYEIFYREEGMEDFELLDYVPKGLEEYKADGLKDNVYYTFKVRCLDTNNNYSDFSIESQPVKCYPQFFKMNKINTLIALLIYIFLLLYFTMKAKGQMLFIRRITGLDHLEEAVGRATEMGKSILYVPGLSGASDIATLASLNILKPVAKKAAEYETPLIVPNYDPVVTIVAQEVVKEAYTEAGRPDAFKRENVFFLTDAQFAYAAGVDGIMVREKPATNLFIGMFYAESLLLAETGNMTGAIQIAGTDAVSQLPFFVAACDYTIMGEELYAASAYLSKEPKLVGSLKAQDLGKVVLTVLVILGSILAIGFKWKIILDLFKTL